MIPARLRQSGFAKRIRSEILVLGRIVMSTLYLQLLNIQGNYKVEKGTLYNAKAYIAIKGSSTVKVDELEFKTISAECRTLKEVEEASDWLTKELKTIKKQAAKFFKNKDEAWRKIAEKSSKQ